MEEYKPNSHRSKELAEDQKVPARKQEKVISGEAHQRKKSAAGRLGNAIISNDAEDVGNYILMDVFVPAIKKMISDIVCNGINMLLGEPERSRKGSNASRVSYRAYYDARDDRRESSQKIRPSYNYDDIIFDNRGDAEDVLDRMGELVDRFDAVSVADLFDMAGLSCNYTDNKYGWTDLSDARVDRVHDGYVIRLPKATTL